MTHASLVHVCLMSAGGTLGTGLLAGAAHAGNREDDSYLPYAVTCFAGTVLFLSLAALYEATTLAATVLALKWHAASVIVVVPSIVWLFARLAQRPTRRSEMRLMLFGSAVFLAVNAWSPASLHFDRITAAAPDGPAAAARDMAFVGHAGWVTAIFHLWLLLPTSICFTNGRHLLRAGNRVLGWVAMGSTGVFLLANAIALRADYMGGTPAYVGAPPMLIALILLLGLSLGLMQRNQRLALVAREGDLRRTVEQLRDEVAQRARLEQRLVQTQRLEALGRMSAGVAHDFNNVLTVAGGRAELLRQGDADRPEQQEHATAILGAVERGAGLTRQLLAFARRQDLVPTALDADRAVEGMRDLLRTLAGPRSRLTLELGAGERRILADPTQFSQVLMNLVANARDAMPEGGSLAVTTAWIERGAAGTCACEGALAGGHVLLAVEDSGSGIEPETLARIFEPFFTTKGPDQGTGLGLATVHGIVRQSGGHIAVASRPGAGTVFRICWPSAATGAASASRASGPPAEVKPA